MKSPDKLKTETPKAYFALLKYIELKDLHKVAISVTSKISEIRRWHKLNEWDSRIAQMTSENEANGKSTSMSAIDNALHKIIERVSLALINNAADSDDSAKSLINQLKILSNTIKIKSSLSEPRQKSNRNSGLLPSDEESNPLIERIKSDTAIFEEYQSLLKLLDSN